MSAPTIDSNERNVLVPIEPPECIPDKFDEELFALCRADDYRGLYRALIRRVIEGKANGK